MFKAKSFNKKLSTFKRGAINTGSIISRSLSNAGDALSKGAHLAGQIHSVAISPQAQELAGGNKFFQQGVNGLAQATRGLNTASSVAHQAGSLTNLNNYHGDLESNAKNALEKYKGIHNTIHPIVFKD